MYSSILFHQIRPGHNLCHKLENVDTYIHRTNFGLPGLFDLTYVILYFLVASSYSPVPGLMFFWLVLWGLGFPVLFSFKELCVKLAY